MKCIVLVMLLSLSASVLVAGQPATVNDWLVTARRAEDMSDYRGAFSAYSAALSLRPDEPTLNMKAAECLMFSDRSAEAAKLLLHAFDLIESNPKSPSELKRYVISMLMGHMLDEWYGEGRIYPIPLTTLPKADQKKIIDAVPKGWLFSNKAQEALFQINIGNHEAGIALLKEAVLAGNWEKVECPMLYRVLKPDQLRAMIKAWQSEAEQTGSPYLWLAVMDSYWHAKQVTELQNAFPSALSALKAKEPFLKALYYLVSQMRWQEGLQAVLPLLPYDPRPRTAEQSFEALDKALTTKDRTTATELIIRIAADYPQEFSEVYGPKYLRRILASGWTDLVGKVMNKDLLQYMPRETKNMLLGDSAYDLAAFDHWMRLFISTDQKNVWEDLLTAAQEHPDAERGIWMLEQGMRIFPNDLALKASFGKKLCDTGYLERAIAVGQETLWETGVKNKIDPEDVYTLWTAAKKLQRTEQVFNKIWDGREKLAITTCLIIANYWYYDKKPDQAVKWAEDAATRAKTKGWERQAKLEAQAYSLMQNNAEARENVLFGAPERLETIYSPGTYTSRLQYLVAAAKKSTAIRVYEEAKKLYPGISFTDRVNGLQFMIPMDWNAEVKYQSDRLLILSQPASYEPFLDPMMKLAYALVKAGCADEATALAPKVLPTRPDWQKGLPLAVDLFLKRIAEGGLLPFVEWTRSLPKDDMLEYQGTSNRRYQFAHAIAAAGDPSLAYAFSATGVLTFPIVSTEEVSFLPVENSKLGFRWANVTQKDRDSLMRLLSPMRLVGMRIALDNMFTTYENMDESLRKWLIELMSSQHSATALLDIVKFTAMAPGGLSAKEKTDISRRLDKLEETKDWDGVSWRFIGLSYARPLMEKGMTAEAIRMVKILFTHVPNKNRIMFVKQINAIMGEKTLPESASTKSDDARNEYLKSMAAAQNNDQRNRAIRQLANADPTAAIEEIEKMMPTFSVADPSGSFEDAITIIESLAHIAYKDRPLAAKVLPLIDRLIALSPEIKSEARRHHAMVSFWAANIPVGMKDLFDGQQEVTADTLDIAFTVILDNPAEIRKPVADAIKRYLAENKVGLSLVTDAMDMHNDFMGGWRRWSAETYTTLAEVFASHLDDPGISVPQKFLEMIVRVVYQIDIFDLDVMPWVPLVEKAFHKAAEPPADAAALADMLQKQIDSPGKGEKWRASEGYRQLAKLAESLRGGKE